MSTTTKNKPGMTFEEHRATTIADCEAVATKITELAAQVRKGDMKAFEKFWIEGGTQEGDAKILSIREILILRYTAREELISSIP